MCPRKGKKHIIWSWNLPEDICLDIFSRLPTKSVMRCRCVCKSWRTWTSSSNTNFVNMHLLNSCTPHPHNPDIVFRDCRSWDVPRFTFSLVENFSAPNQVLNPLLVPLHLPSPCLVGSCNGLICFINLTNPFRLVYICNPCTGESTQFPLSSSRCQGDFLGFGHDPILDEYKVVTVNNERVGEVWTLGSDLWRRTTDVPFMRTGTVGHWSYVSLDGALHWISQGSALTVTIGIGSFHIASEEYQFVPLPTEVCEDPVEFFGKRFIIGTLQGCISVAKFAGYGINKIEVWATNNHRLQGCWSKQYVMEANLLCQMCIFGNWDVLFDNEDRIAPMDLGGVYLIEKGTNLGLENIVKITDAFVHVGSLVSPIRVCGDGFGKISSCCESV